MLVLKTPTSFREVKRISLFCPENAQFEKGFSLWLETMKTLAEQLQLKIKINCESGLTIDSIRKYIEKINASKFFDVQNGNMENLSNGIIKHSVSDLLIFVHSRKKAISHSRSFENLMNNSINIYKKNNVIIIYPEQ